MPIARAEAWSRWEPALWSAGSSRLELQEYKRSELLRAKYVLRRARTWRNGVYYLRIRRDEPLDWDVIRPWLLERAPGRIVNRSFLLRLFRMELLEFDHEVHEWLRNRARIDSMKTQY